MKTAKVPATCSICGEPFPQGTIFPLATVRPTVFAEIERDHPEIGRSGYICRQDLAKFRTRYVQNLLVSEKMDHLLMHQWERLVEIQQVQIELLEELGERSKGSDGGAA